MLSYELGRVGRVPLSAVAGRNRLIPPVHPLLRCARRIGVSFGEGVAWQATLRLTQRQQCAAAWLAQSHTDSLLAFPRPFIPPIPVSRPANAMKPALAAASRARPRGAIDTFEVFQCN
jgi:hypothetical protein